MPPSCSIEGEKKRMRLSEGEIATVKRCFEESFLSGDRLWLFGSRVDLEKRGGDLDFYVETSETDVGKALKRKDTFLLALWRQLGEQRIDLVLNILVLGEVQPIFQIAQREGVRLV